MKTMELYVPTHLQGKLHGEAWTKKKPPKPPFRLQLFHKKVGGSPVLSVQVGSVEESHDPGGGRGRTAGPIWLLRWFL